MDTIQTVTVNNNTPPTVEKINVEKLTYTPSCIINGDYIYEQCTIATQKGMFSAWGILAEECITHLPKGHSLCCTYTTEEGKAGIVQINGCNSTKVLKECYK